MLLSSPQALDDHLVMLLARKRSATAAELQLALSEQYGKFTIQGIYKELNKLQAAGVIVRQHGRYGLNLAWILNLAELADTMFETQTSGADGFGILPETQEKTTFVFRRLAHVDDFWIHALLMLLEKSESGVLYQWIPHPWFHLIHGQKSKPLHNALKVSGFKAKSIIGGSSYLDRYSETYTMKGTYEFFYAPGPFADEPRRYYSVTDRHLFTVTLDKTVAENLDAIYANVSSPKDFDSVSAINLLNRPGTIRVTIDQRPANVRRIRKKFLAYFGD